MVAVGPVRDEAWFEAVFRATSPRVRSFVARRVSVDVDDVVAQVYAVAWAKRHVLPAGAELAWLYRAAHLEIAHANRTLARRAALTGAAARAVGGPAADPAEVVPDRLDAARAAAALAALPEPDAEVLRLWAWEDLAPHEIATVLGVSPATARLRLHRARRRALHLLTELDHADHSTTAAVDESASRRIDPTGPVLDNPGQR